MAVLREILVGQAYEEVATRPPAPRLEHYPSGVRAAILALYRQLGGIRDAPLLRPGAWDLPLEDGLVIELDEEQHFTRYRRGTLDAPWAEALPWTTAYRRYADSGDAHGGTGGSRWTSPAAEKLFGPADPDGTFARHGAPRWKQRALYDAMKDAAAAAGLVRLARISVYDTIDGISLERVLRGRAEVSADGIVELIRARTAQA